MDQAEHSSALRLTNFNHEEKEELILQEKLCATISESVRQAFEEAKKLAEEEAELSRRASKAEYKRLADQEVMKIAVERAARIAEVELKKQAEAQEMGPQQDKDTIMVDQENDKSASGKDKNVVVDSTPSSSPIRTIRESGSPSSAIPPAVQVALDEMKTEMNSDITEMKTDISEMKTAMEVKDQATNDKMDKMMLFHQDIASRLPKP
jgi:hypothetical protein